MKGIILAGGNGTRLAPLTSVVNKHLLPVYNKPMILYPLQKLIDDGITDIMLITGGEHIGRFIEFLGDGSRFGVKLTYRVQESAGGIAQAFALCESFAQNEDVTVILGDNIFAKSFSAKPSAYPCTIFLKDTDEASARRFGCAITEGDKVTYVEEKPEYPRSHLAVSGCYIFPNSAFEVVKTLKPSGRGELEITDVINYYVQKDECGFSMIEGQWYDAGTFDSLLAANTFAHEEYKTI